MSTKELHAARVRAELDELRAEVDKLKARAAKAGIAGRTKFSRYLETLDEKRSEVSHRLEAVGESGEEAWDDVKHGLKEARQRLAIARLAAKSRFH